MKNEYIRLAKNLLVLAAFIIIGVVIYRFFASSESEELTIDTTPIHIESIKTIAEISTVSYRDEVVIDTVEFYKKSSNFYDPEEWVRLFKRNVKRRLTLIVKGEIKYGLDLSKKNYTIRSNADTVWINLPQPKMLDIIISPSRTEIFQEQGDWSDATRRQLEDQAKFKMIENAKTLSLQSKAEENTVRLFKKLIHTKQQLIIQFDENI